MTTTQSPWDTLASVGRAYSASALLREKLSGVDALSLHTLNKDAAVAAPSSSHNAKEAAATATGIEDAAWERATAAPESGYLGKHGFDETWERKNGSHSSLKGRWGIATVENGIIVKRDYCEGGQWGKASCAQCKKAYWKDGAQPHSLCGPCAKRIDVGEECRRARERQVQRRLTFLLGSRSGAECAVSKLPPDVLRQIVESI